MTTLTKCTRLSTAERMILDRFAAEAQEILGDNLVSLILFGSRARGNAHPDSDVDLLLVLKDLKEASPALDILDEVVLDLLLDHGLLLAMVPVETSEFDRQEGPLYRIVKRKGIRIL